MMTRKTLLPILIASLCLATSQAFAETSSGDSYSISNETISILTLTPTVNPASHLRFLTPTPPPQSTYSITIPQGNGSALDLFSIKLADHTVSYGPLSPANPVLRETALTTTPGKTFGYLVMVSEEGPLTNEKGQQIPDTRCDQGACTEDVAATWDNLLTYGFGYTCSSRDVTCVGFSPETYKPFTKASRNTPSILYYGLPDQSVSATLRYKVNIANSQEKGQYMNRTSLLAIPYF